MAITVSDDWAWVTFDSGWELLWVLLLAFVFGACSGCLFTVVYPALADRLLTRAVIAVVATVRLIKSLLVGPEALGIAA